MGATWLARGQGWGGESSRRGYQFNFFFKADFKGTKLSCPGLFKSRKKEREKPNISDQRPKKKIMEMENQGREKKIGTYLKLKTGIKHFLNHSSNSHYCQRWLISKTNWSLSFAKTCRDCFPRNYGTSTEIVIHPREFPVESLIAKE